MRQIQYRRIHEHIETKEIKITYWGFLGEDKTFTSPATITNHTVVSDEQFSGCYDMHGKPIFEGDVFFISDKYRDEFERNTYFKVVFADGGFWMEVIKSDTELLGNRLGSYIIGQQYPITKKHEVIGNIHDKNTKEEQ